MIKPFRIVLAGTVAALAAVVGLHPRASNGHSLSSGAASAASSATTPTTTSPTAPNPTTPTTTSPTAPNPSSSAPTPTLAGVHSSTGPIEQYGYGQLSVRVTIANNKITQLAVPTLQTAEQYSQQLAAQVIPMLTNEVLTAQSININGISGATYTAEAYVTSLQSALKNLHFK